MNPAITGRCLCGSTTIEISCSPESMDECHCTDCQKIASGGPCHHIVVPASALQVRSSTVRTYESEADSGNTITRVFCGTCGTPLYNFVDDDARFVYVGVLDDPSIYRPQNVFWTRSAPPWHQLPEGIPAHATGGRDSG